MLSKDNNLNLINFFFSLLHHSLIHRGTLSSNKLPVLSVALYGTVLPLLLTQ